MTLGERLEYITDIWLTFKYYDQVGAEIHECKSRIQQAVEQFKLTEATAEKGYPFFYIPQ